MRSLISVTHPHLRETFLGVIDNNGNIDSKLTWFDLTSKSKHVAMWKCPNFNCQNNCEHIYSAQVGDVTRKDRPVGCSFCRKGARQVCKCNSLQGKYPHIIEQFWDYNANGDLNPSHIPPQSNKKVWLRCRRAKCNHHRWQTNINSVIAKNLQCPFCTSHKFCECYCLFSEYPELIEFEWDYEKNLNLDFWSIGPYSEKKAWWNCRTCHCEWQARIDSRTHQGTGCPHCKKSHMEKNMSEILTSMCEIGTIKNFECLYPLSGTRLIADFCVTLIDNSFIILEMDGEQHFRPKSFGSKKRSKEEMFKEIQEWDRRKKEWCANNNMRLLRISYLVKKTNYETELLDFFASPNVAFRLVGQPLID